MIKFKKLIALFTGAFFLFSHLVSPRLSWAVVEIASVNEAKLSKSFHFEIPSDLGAIESVSVGDGPTLIHIQEAHGYYEVQKNIESILRHLKDNYKIKTIFLEGSSFELDPTLLNFFPEKPELNREIAEELAQEGLASGPELFLFKEKGTRALGVESLDAYVKNGAAFKEVLRQRYKTKNFLKNMNLQIERLTSPYLNKDLRTFLNRLNAYEEGVVPFDKWSEELKGYVQKNLDIDLTNPWFQVDWPMLLRIFTLKAFESKLNRKDFKNEREKFLKVVSKMPKNIYSEVERLLENPMSGQRLSSSEVSFLFERMVSFLPQNFDHASYPNVNLAIGYLILRSELKGEKLMAELDKLTDLLSAKLSKNEQEENIARLLKDYRMLKRLFALELSPEDYKVISTPVKKLELKPSAIIPKFYSLNKDNRVRNVEFEGVAEVDELFQRALSFYQGTEERDLAMIENIESQMKAFDGSNTKFVVITGGFHAGPFKEYFEGRGYNYALISPRMTQVLEETNYANSIVESFDSPLSGATLMRTQNSTHPLWQEHALIGVSPEREQAAVNVVSSIAVRNGIAPSRIVERVNQNLFDGKLVVESDFVVDRDRLEDILPSEDEILEDLKGSLSLSETRMRMSLAPALTMGVYLELTTELKQELRSLLQQLLNGVLTQGNRILLQTRLSMLLEGVLNEKSLLTGYNREDVEWSIQAVNRGEIIPDYMLTRLRYVLSPILSGSRYKMEMLPSVERLVDSADKNEQYVQRKHQSELIIPEMFQDKDFVQRLFEDEIFIWVLFRDLDMELTEDEKTLLDMRYGLFEHDALPLEEINVQAKKNYSNPYIELTRELKKIENRVSRIYQRYLEEETVDTSSEVRTLSTILPNEAREAIIETGVRSIQEFLRNLATYADDRENSPYADIATIEPLWQAGLDYVADEDAYSREVLVGRGDDFLRDGTDAIPRIEDRGGFQVAVVGVPGDYRDAFLEPLQAAAGNIPLTVRKGGFMTLEANVANVDKSLPVKFVAEHFDELLDFIGYTPGTHIDARQTRTVIFSDADGTILGKPGAGGVMPELHESAPRGELNEYLSYGGVLVFTSGGDTNLLKGRILRENGIELENRNRVIVVANGSATMSAIRGEELELFQDYEDNSLAELANGTLNETIAQVGPNTLDRIYLGDDRSPTGNDWPGYVGVGLSNVINVYGDYDGETGVGFALEAKVSEELHPNYVGGLDYGTKYVLAEVNQIIREGGINRNTPLFTSDNIASIVSYARTQIESRSEVRNEQSVVIADRIAMIGASSYVGREIFKILAENMPNLIGTTYQSQVENMRQLDLTDEASIQQFLEEANPEVIIYVAAAANPVQVEQDSTFAQAVNVDAVKTLTDNFDGQLIYFSSDFVFAGNQLKKYSPESEPDPINAYGRTKRDGERVVLAGSSGKNAVIRLGVVFGQEKSSRNFITTVVQGLDTNKPRDYFSKHNRHPIGTPDIARLVEMIIREKKTGVFQLNAEETVTLYEWAQLIARVYFDIYPEKVHPYDSVEEAIEKLIRPINDSISATGLQRPINAHMQNSIPVTPLRQAVNSSLVVQKSRSEVRSLSTLLPDEAREAMIETGVQSIQEFLRNLATHADDRENSPYADIATIEPLWQAGLDYVADEDAYSREVLVGRGDDFLRDGTDTIPRIEDRGGFQVAIVGVPGDYRDAFLEPLQQAAGNIPLSVKKGGFMTLEANVTNVDKALPIRYVARHYDELLDFIGYTPGTHIDARKTRTVILSDADGTQLGKPAAEVTPALHESAPREEINDYLSYGGVLVLISGNDTDLIRRRILEENGIKPENRNRVIVVASGSATMSAIRGEELELYEPYQNNALNELENGILNKTVVQRGSTVLDRIYLGDDRSKNGNDWPGYDSTGLGRSINTYGNYDEETGVGFALKAKVPEELHRNYVGGLEYGTKHVLAEFNRIIAEGDVERSLPLFTRANISRAVRYARTQIESRSEVRLEKPVSFVEIANDASVQGGILLAENYTGFLVLEGIRSESPAVFEAVVRYLASEYDFSVNNVRFENLPEKLRAFFESDDSEVIRSLFVSAGKQVEPIRMIRVNPSSASELGVLILASILNKNFKVFVVVEDEKRAQDFQREVRDYVKNKLNLSLSESRFEVVAEDARGLVQTLNGLVVRGERTAILADGKEGDEVSRAFGELSVRSGLIRLVDNSKLSVAEEMVMSGTLLSQLTYLLTQKVQYTSDHTKGALAKLFAAARALAKILQAA